MTALILLSEFQKTEIELWRPVEGFPGYDVSSLGRIRSYWKKQLTPHGGGKRGSACAYVLSGAPVILNGGRQESNEYHRATLSRDGKLHYLTVHALVAHAFVPNDRPGIAIQVNHKTHVKRDNRYPNLEWVTVSENAQRAIEAGVWPMGTTHGMAKLTVVQVLEIRRRCETGETYASVAIGYPVTPEAVRNIHLRKVWKNVV